MKDKNLNKTIARFSYRGKIYEMDYLIDADNDDYKEYDIFHFFDCIVHLGTQETKKSRLIQLAKEELSDII